MQLNFALVDIQSILIFFWLVGSPFFLLGLNGFRSFCLTIMLFLSDQLLGMNFSRDSWGISCHSKRA